MRRCRTATLSANLLAVTTGCAGEEPPDGPLADLAHTPYALDSS